jgi:hypothetical protein
MVLLYGCETWKLFKKNLLNSFERKIFRIIFGLVRENGRWRIRYDKELYREYKDLDLVSRTKFKTLQWAGHVQRLPLNRIPKKTLTAKFTGNCPAGRPRFKYEEGVNEDAAKLPRCSH